MINSKFDPLEAEIEFLDDQFYNWLHSATQDEADFYREEWHNAAHEPLVYTADEIYEGWGADIEDFVETNNLAVDKRLHEEIQRKRRIIKDINEDEDVHFDS